MHTQNVAFTISCEVGYDVIWVSFLQKKKISNSVLEVGAMDGDGEKLIIKFGIFLFFIFYILFSLTLID